VRESHCARLRPVVDYLWEFSVFAGNSLTFQATLNFADDVFRFCAKYEPGTRCVRFFSVTYAHAKRPAEQATAFAIRLSAPFRIFHWAGLRPNKSVMTCPVWVDALDDQDKPVLSCVLVRFFVAHVAASGLTVLCFRTAPLALRVLGRDFGPVVQMSTIAA